jgi:hypothetical protein
MVSLKGRGYPVNFIIAAYQLAFNAAEHCEYLTPYPFYRTQSTTKFSSKYLYSSMKFH